jgi:uncharacterized Zn-finger protein
MRPDSYYEGSQSPSVASQHSAASAPSYFQAGSINNMDSLRQRQSYYGPPSKRPPPSTPFASSPSSLSSSSGFPSHHTNDSPYYPQRSHPYERQDMRPAYPQPLVIPVSHPSAQSNPWQHHHYISPSSQAAFPQSQDRYICQTCNKAFSRPSSLRIHSHSHTGEKPFKCPHHGCGKAFSVRSNMKRHERGCHSSNVAL